MNNYLILYLIVNRVSVILAYVIGISEIARFESEGCMNSD
jgi:hypothetical protein